MSERTLRSSTKNQKQKVSKPIKNSEGKSKKENLKTKIEKKIETPELKLSDIVLEDDSGRSYNIENDIIKAGKPTLIFAYPKASTPGCTKQAQGFRDFYKLLTETDKISTKDFQIFGLSNDTIKAQLNFKQKHEFQFPLLSDPERKLISYLKADKNEKTGTIRSHWVWDRNGVLRYEHVAVSPDVSLEKGKEELKELINEN
ncbi:thioredoxin-like protein [Hanseniaspora valbyensis NRRL Y-1626]|uniref:thioredoxin-dependent peroxiredoxin n=1 Tax=Hanseniaspora valbyensis NRRL Y-1626 TaxID=766949 RepID=A0A1B7TFW9_9ASCO|nr:thioredoxin-like protein [Hanseniaspora valbyensis NRRL Y-1626]